MVGGREEGGRGGREGHPRGRGLGHPRGRGKRETVKTRNVHFQIFSQLSEEHVDV
jgi:hypothetical protein